MALKHQAFKTFHFRVAENVSHQRVSNPIIFYKGKHMVYLPLCGKAFMCNVCVSMLVCKGFVTLLDEVSYLDICSFEQSSGSGRLICPFLK